MNSEIEENKVVIKSDYIADSKRMIDYHTIQLKEAVEDREKRRKVSEWITEHFVIDPPCPIEIHFDYAAIRISALSEGEGIAAWVTKCIHLLLKRQFNEYSGTISWKATIEGFFSDRDLVITLSGVGKGRCHVEKIIEKRTVEDVRYEIVCPDSEGGTDEYKN